MKIGIKLSDPTLSNILEVHSPIVLGSVGSAVGALAGAVLVAAGKFSSFSSSLVYDFRQGLPYDGIVERAILGEAAFSVVMSMKRIRLEKEGVFANLAAVVKQLSPATKRVAPYIVDTPTAPALQIALDTLHNKTDNSAARYCSASLQGTPFAQSLTPSGTTLDGDIETFVKKGFRRISSITMIAKTLLIVSIELSRSDSARRPRTHCRCKRRIPVLGIFLARVCHMYQEETVRHLTIHKLMACPSVPCSAKLHSKLL